MFHKFYFNKYFSVNSSSHLLISFFFKKINTFKSYYFFLFSFFKGASSLPPASLRSFTKKNTSVLKTGHLCEAPQKKSLVADAFLKQHNLNFSQYFFLFGNWKSSVFFFRKKGVGQEHKKSTIRELTLTLWSFFFKFAGKVKKGPLPCLSSFNSNQTYL